MIVTSREDELTEEEGRTRYPNTTPGGQGVRQSREAARRALWGGRPGGVLR